MGCFGFCKENDAYTTADKGIFMQTNPNGGNTSYHGRHTAVTVPRHINLQPISVPSITVDELRSLTDNFGTKTFVGEGAYGKCIVPH
ncbi:putative non-specific serine/threonine protein kinase [Medicago truncatula]|uniref:Putative non-specific serine/threonine protein kinase n=1 Tax=Medicago truncatula TaxID=3880 RepID=A0A396GID4_MEDTR|nr:putative non-specific serine/threonine protein kinase [Medicago truncatula]